MIENEITEENKSMNRLIRTVQKTSFYLGFNRDGGKFHFIGIQKQVFDRKIEVDQMDMITADIKDDSVVFQEKVWSFGKYISINYHQAEYSSDSKILVDVKKLQKIKEIN